MSIPALDGTCRRFSLDTQLGTLNSQRHKLGKSKANQDICYLLLLLSLPRGQEDAPESERDASSSPEFKGHSPEAEQCLRHWSRSQGRMALLHISAILSRWKHALFFPLSCCGGACLRNGRSTAAWFPRDALIGPCWWYKPRWGFLCSKATPSSSSPCESLVACPGWGCSCFPLSSGRTLAVFTLF